MRLGRLTRSGEGRGRAPRRGSASVEAMIGVAVFSLFLVAAVRLGVVQVEVVRCLAAARLQADVHRQHFATLSTHHLRRATGSRTLEREGTRGSASQPSPGLIRQVVGMLRSATRWMLGSKTWTVRARPSSRPGWLGLELVTVRASATTVEGCWNLGDVKRFAWGLFGW